MDKHELIGQIIVVVMVLLIIYFLAEGWDKDE